MDPITERKADDSVDGYVTLADTNESSIDEIRNAVVPADPDDSASPVAWGYPTPTK